MPLLNDSAVSIAILAKAPIPGLAKTRLIPAIGAHAAAVLQERLTERAVCTAIAADVGPVTLWCAPDATHSTFARLVTDKRITLKPQPQGDLGARMFAAAAARNGSVLVIGTDCPALTDVHLRGAANALRDGIDVILIPAEDGGFVLIGTGSAQPALFTDIAWGTDTVLAQTRARIVSLRLGLAERTPLWDVDTEADLARLEREYPELKL
ncbi:MAG TPA: TIGR04282 family arsenosugar biosynthesis glycosyltransferase [Pseudolabrys sp.]|nr:TIGR04282 family arsenosugar biosynthesis glycosyltransferase [Pseudolabrys sp.]